MLVVLVIGNHNSGTARVLPTASGVTATHIKDVAAPDLLHLLLQLTGPQQPPVMVEPDLEVTASVVHDNVPAVLDVLDGV